MVIDGPLWFIGALLLFGGHVLFLRGWRRERREQLAKWAAYDAQSQERHDTFMHALDEVAPVPKLALDPATQKIVDDFNDLSKKRAVELLGPPSEQFRGLRDSLFCLGYKAGVIDAAAAARSEIQ